MLRLMILSMLLSMLLVSAAHAAHLDDVCTAAFKPNDYANPPIFSGNLLSRTGVGEDVIEDLTGKKIYSTTTEIKDFIVSGDKIWVLNPYDVVELNSQGVEQGAYTFEKSNSSNFQGKSFALAGNTLLIAQGLGGMKAFDTVTHEIKWVSYFADVEGGGLPVSVATDGKRAYVVMATSIEGGFTGVVTVDIETGALLGQVAYHRTWGVIATDPRATWRNDSLVLNNGGWIHVITKKQIDSGKAIKPRWVAHVVEASGPVNQHYMMLTGGFFFEQNNLVGCGVYTAHENGIFTRKSSLFKVKMP